MTQRVIVVGAGTAGVAAARTLVDHGREVLVLEAALRPGGRLSGRLIKGKRVNDGASYFTANSPRFREALEPSIAQGDVAAWPGRWHRWGDGRLRAEGLMGNQRRLIAANGLPALWDALSNGLQVRTETRACALSVESGRWRVQTQSGDVESADGLVLAVPAPEATRLARTAEDSFNPLTLADVARVTFDPAVVVVAGYEDAQPAWQAIVSDEGPVSWMGIEPGQRTFAQTAVAVHGSAEWSKGAVGQDDAAVAQALLKEAAVVGGAWLASPKWAHVVRWEHARPVILASARAPASEGVGPPAVFCGDWCAAPHVEGAFLSGVGAGERLTFML